MLRSTEGACTKMVNNFRPLPTFRNLPVPNYWRGRVEDIDQEIDKATRGQVITLGLTAGGRTIRGLAYGTQPKLRRTANFSSALGASKPYAYANKNDRLPSLMLVGGVHGSEIEAIVGLVNLIHILEKGTDLMQRSWPELTEMAGKIRLIVIPCLNLDGRARVEIQSYVGESLAVYRYWMQGTHANGSPYSWPEVKEYHPLEDVGFLGGYFNDNRINLMHDNFFYKPSTEVDALMALTNDEAPDIIASLHSAADSPFYFCGVSHLPSIQQEAMFDLSERVRARMTEKHLPFRGMSDPKLRTAQYVSDFNLLRALHHHSGAATVTIESCAGIETPNPACQLNWEQILDGQLILCNELISAAFEDSARFRQPFFG